ncbi:MAG: (d)CMP kinase [bacterium]|nr:(d)CMP kinase [bacterium]
MIVTIDGPAGSGKSSAARMLAEELGFIHLNSGAIFRAIGVAAQEQGVPLDDEAALEQVGRRMKFSFYDQNTKMSGIFVDGVDWGQLILTEDAGKVASRIAVFQRVRDVAAELQRNAGQNGNIVVEGRDAGSVIFPDADFKFYLDASVDVRARRRLRQLESATVTLEPIRQKVDSIGQDFDSVHGDFDSIRRDIAERDLRDSTRTIAPQTCPKDALRIDTSDISLAEVVAKMVAVVESFELNDVQSGV